MPPLRCMLHRSLGLDDECAGFDLKGDILASLMKFMIIIDVACLTHVLHLCMDVLYLCGIQLGESEG